jgi:hypothetical protein
MSRGAIAALMESPKLEVFNRRKGATGWNERAAQVSIEIFGTRNIRLLLLAEVRTDSFLSHRTGCAIRVRMLRTNAQDVGGNNSFMQDDTRDYTNYTNQGEQPTVLTDSG